MARKRTLDLEQELNDFLEFWDCDYQIAFLRDIIPLFELYDVEDENDWVKEAVGEENERNVRLIRTIYLMSRIAEIHSRRLCRMKMEFKDLWIRMEKQGVAIGVER